MKKFILMLMFLMTTSTAAANPSCILMKFTDDTRFDLVESAESLSDLVMEKLIASGKFKLMETNPIEENMEIQLYNEKLRDLKFLEDAIKKAETPAEVPPVENADIESAEKINTAENSVAESAEKISTAENSVVESAEKISTTENPVADSAEKINTAENTVTESEENSQTEKTAPPVIDLTPLFEGVGFDENRAQSIATAQVGQIINPEITSAIGKAHNADYLIQGTIINLGTGTWWNEDFEKLSDAMNMLSGLSNTSIPLGMLGNVLSGIDIGKIGVGVQCDLRVIKAETGEVVWSKRVVGVNDQVNMNLGIVSIGSRKLNNNFYAKAMDKAADKIVTALIADSKNIFQ